MKLDAESKNALSQLGLIIVCITILTVICYTISFIQENAIHTIAKASIVIEDVKHSIDSTKQELRTNGH